MELRQVNRELSGADLSLPAPIGGWNTRDALADMPVTDAIAMENLFPGTDSVFIRPGHVEHANGMGSSSVLGLVAWHGPASEQLIVTTSGGVWNATAGGAAVNIVANSTYANDYWQMSMFNGRLHAVNGNDPPWNYDGTTLVASAWTGPTDPNDLIQLLPFKGRLYFVERNSGLMWYAPPGAHTGALVSFDLGQIAQLGGFLVALGSWSVTDAGTGLDDRFVAVMSTGEILIYTGISPADAQTWNLTGSYKGSDPIGLRCLENLGGELIIMTQNGYLPLSVLVRDGTIDALENHPVWGKIRQAIEQAATGFGTVQGWEAHLSPTGETLFFNTPQSSQFSNQHILNPVSGAWSLYSGLNATTWAHLGNINYFGKSDGKVYRLEGATDLGASIAFSADQAYSYFGTRSRSKRFTAARPLIEVDGALQIDVTMNLDFRQKSQIGSQISIGASPVGAKWDVDKWDVGKWGQVATTPSRWISVRGIGRAASISIRGATQAQNFIWYATDFLGQIGGLR